jgi:hypothetical protein
MASSRTRFAALLSVIALLWGCTGHQRLYGGPTLPPDKVAVIKGSIGVLPGSSSLSIMSVDGKPLSPYADRIEVLPGPHTLGVQYRLQLGGGLVAKGEIGVDALPGKTYELQSKRDGDIVTFSIAEAKEQK